jgi:hypothetical protein
MQQLVAKAETGRSSPESRRSYLAVLPLLLLALPAYGSVKAQSRLDSIFTTVEQLHPLEPRTTYDAERSFWQCLLDDCLIAPIISFICLLSLLSSCDEVEQRSSSSNRPRCRNTHCPTSRYAPIEPISPTLIAIPPRRWRLFAPIE